MVYMNGFFRSLGLLTLFEVYSWLMLCVPLSSRPKTSFSMSEFKGVSCNEIVKGDLVALILLLWILQFYYEEGVTYICVIGYVKEIFQLMREQLSGKRNILN